MTGPGYEQAVAVAGRGHLRASRADREQMIDALKAAFVQGRLTKEKRVNLRAGQEVRLDQGPAAGTVIRFDGAVPFVNLQVSHDPGQTWVLVFAITMMAGLLVSLLVRRRRVWVRLMPAQGAPGTVMVELGGLARTDNSGWGDEFERLTERLLDGLGESGVPDSAANPAQGPASRRSSQVDVT